MVAVYGYTRASTNHQDTGLETQEREIRSYAERKSLGPVRGIFVDNAQSGLTTKMLDRPAGGDMMRLIEPGDVVVVQDVDRLGRDMFDILDTVKFITSRCRLCVINMMGMEVDTQTMGGKLILAVFAWASEWAARNMKEKAAQGRANRKAKGLGWIGQSGFGYRNAGRDGMRHRVPHDKEQRIVQLIMDLRLRGWGALRIARALRKYGVRRPDGKDLSEQVVRKIIRREKESRGLVLPKANRDQRLYSRAELEEYDIEYIMAINGEEVEDDT